ncbi:MAG: nucleotidyl transferase AbiEii/AbiGii toxin family protein [Saprospiraceae bacterium]
MILLSEIQKFYPEELQGYKRFLLREYLQYKILEIIFESQFASNFCFLGGTNLRLIHDNQRFSEDLDFDHFNVSENIFDDVSNLIAEKLKKEGFEIEISIIKKGAFHCYIKFPELLFNQGLSPIREEKILIQLDTEAQHYEYTPELFILNKFDVFVPINVCKLELLLAQKIFAILNRKRNKGRDFFDVLFILSKSNKIDFGYLKQKAGLSNSDQIKDKLLEKCATLDMNQMADDVAPFLFQPKDIQKIIYFENFIKQVTFI